jgi:hypothetical protein
MDGQILGGMGVVELVSSFSWFTLMRTPLLTLPKY